MERLSKRQLNKIRHFFREKEERARSEKFRHRAPSGDGREKESTIRVLAGQVDQMLIAVSFVQPPLKPGLVDRLLVIAGLEKVDPVVILNKADLLKDRKEGEELRSLYRSLGYQAFMTSTVTGEGLDLLQEQVRERTSLLAGHSGVGKSSLLNALLPDTGAKAAVKHVSHATSKGVHTTTSIRLHQIGEKTAVIDLPGVKLVSLYDLEPGEISRFFPEFTSYARRCRFSDCLHIREPGCGVKEGLEAGGVHPLRYASYVRMVEKPRALS
jgi:ribosome biogenesis GTPase